MVRIGRIAIPLSDVCAAKTGYGTLPPVQPASCLAACPARTGPLVLKASLSTHDPKPTSAFCRAKLNVS